MAHAATQDRIDQTRRAYTDAWFTGVDADAALAAWMEACREGETDRETHDRLIREAKAKRESAGRHDEAEAEFAGKAAHRRLRGDEDMAADFDTQARAARRCSERAITEATAMEAEAAAIARRQDFAAFVVASVAQRAA